MINTDEMTIGEILKYISPIRKNKIDYQSNYYNQCNCLRDKFSVSYTENALIFIWNDLGINRVYFFSSNVKELTLLLSQLKEGSVIDFITKNKSVLKNCFIQAGFALHLEYGRFFIKPNQREVIELQKEFEGDGELKEFFDSPYGEIAKESDAEEIDSCLRRVFDPYEAHFYSLDILREYISKGWVWIAKENGKIIAGSCFEIQGKKVYGSYIWNDGDVEVFSSLNHKVTKYLSSLDVTYYYCWMRLNNKRIIRYNMKYNGYVPDGLYDMIYLKS